MAASASAQVIKLEYYQTSDKIVITLYEKNLDEAQVKVDCQAKRLKVTHGEKVLLNSSLCKEVTPESMTFVIRPRKIEITLKKVESAQWECLEDKRQDELDAKKTPTDRWAKLIQEDEAEDFEAKDVDGVLKKIFANCDDDAKKAMMKSWSESGGKVLNTNWDECKGKKVEPKSKDDDDED